MRFSGKTVLITGASAGIGRALALEFAREGATVAIAARRLDLLETLARDIEGLGRKALPIRCDVTKEEEVKAAIATAVSTYGALHTVKSAIPALEKTRGRLALVGSVSGYVAVPATGAYAMSKFAVRALADALFHELRPKGIAVTLISPGFIESDFRQVDNQGVHHPGQGDPYPQWIVMRVETAARKIVRAVARGKREIILTGHGKLAVFLQRHFPWVLSLFFRWSGYRGRREPGAGT